jgi:hypothetical protein
MTDETKDGKVIEPLEFYIEVAEFDTNPCFRTWVFRDRLNEDRDYYHCHRDERIPCA